jgi:hypothetical protein
MNKRTYIIAFLTFFSFGIGTMFEFFHWPYRGFIMFAGFLLLNFGLLPSFFMDMYKRALINK